MERTKVANLKDKMSVTSTYMVSSKHKMLDKNGKPYLIVHLADKTGSIHGMVWDKADALEDLLKDGGVFQFKGNVQDYNGKLQFVIHTATDVSEDSVELSEFVDASEENPVEVYDKLMTLVNSLKNGPVKELLLATLKDDEVHKRILKYPAAKSIHHARIGGLIEHIYSICGIMEFLAGHYKQLNRELLIYGAIYHDIGKLWELKIEGGFGYTDKGRLVGHMQIACEMIDQFSQGIEGFDEDLRTLLKHIILSHHGKLEYGSPKRPKTLEAMVVAMIDDLDSKVDSLTHLMKAEIKNEDQWTRYNAQYDRYFFLGTLLDSLGKEGK